MRSKKYVPFEKAFHPFQRMFIAEWLLAGRIDEVKRDFASRKVEYTDELAEEIKIKYGKKNNKEM